VAEKGSQLSEVVVSAAPSQAGDQTIVLILDKQADGKTATNPASAASQSMEFSDKPNFTIAGVTDWTAVGGHGSDASLRTSEALARETASLKSADSRPTAADESRTEGESENKLREDLARDPHSYAANRDLGMFYLRAGRYQDAILPLNMAVSLPQADDEVRYQLALAYEHAGDPAKARDTLQPILSQGNADWHSLAAEIDETLDDPLHAVHEFERAIELSPTEQNYFAWGSELLVHRAVWQAQQVFQK